MGEAASTVPPTPIEGLKATDFVLGSTEHATNCQVVTKLLFDLGAPPALAQALLLGFSRSSYLCGAQASSTNRSR
jgi:hypothetical protein